MVLAGEWRASWAGAEGPRIPCGEEGSKCADWGQGVPVFQQMGSTRSIALGTLVLSSAHVPPRTGSSGQEASGARYGCPHSVPLLHSAGSRILQWFPTF